MTGYLKEYLKKNDVEYKEKEKLSKYSAIKIGGESEILAYPDSENKLLELIRFCKDEHVRHRVVGNISNLLPSDGRYDGVIIKTDRLKSVDIWKNTVTAECGVRLPFLSSFLADAELSGFEGLSGIPGQIGGSIRGNSGAFGREISDILLSCRVYSSNDDRVFELTNKELDFSYRKSLISKEPFTVLSAKFKLAFAGREAILFEMNRFRDIRRSTQPIDYPSMGSFFKRTDDCIPARLIDECGLKGMGVGGAAVSKKHAGFIINLGGATSSDVLSLASIIEERVFHKFSVRLQREVEILI